MAPPPPPVDRRPRRPDAAVCVVSAEYVEECQALADSFDSHVTTTDVLLALDLLMNRIESEGITDDEDGDE